MEYLNDLFERYGYSKLLNGFNLEEVALLYRQYLTDRLSVDSEWRERFDAWDDFNKLINNDKDAGFHKHKDDEAFRLFLESDIDF